tara:strand:+ start:90 stop:398 length:309 start_codon:yes stop_codon:yes gene_type:complete
MAETFEISLGPKEHYSDQQHNPRDFYQEVLIDFSNPPYMGEGASLGWLAAIHATHGADIDHWALIGEDGDALPGVRLTYETKAQALSAASAYVSDFTGLSPA